MITKAMDHLGQLCATEDRAPGNSGNLAASAYIKTTLEDLGWAVHTDKLDVVGWEHGEVSLQADGASIPAHAGYYSLGCKVAAPLVAASTVDELASAVCTGKILLAHGELTREQLLPPSFPFLKWPEHERIYELLLEKRPAAILAVTDSNPGFAGALSPFPWIEDGTFEIPHAFCHTDYLPQLLQAREAHLQFEAHRFAAEDFQVRASRGAEQGRKIVCTAHVDSKPHTPGALDNATGVATLLLLAERMRDYEGAPVELVFVNGEDYWDVTGEKLLVEQNAGMWDTIEMNINLDALGARESKTGYSTFGLNDSQQHSLNSVIEACLTAAPMAPWYASDHMVFVQQGCAAVAVTSDNFDWLCEQVTHTEKDTPDGVDPALLADAAETLERLIRELTK